MSILILLFLRQCLFTALLLVLQHGICIVKNKQGGFAPVSFHKIISVIKTIQQTGSYQNDSLANWIFYNMRHLTQAKKSLKVAHKHPCNICTSVYPSAAAQPLIFAGHQIIKLIIMQKVLSFPLQSDLDLFYCFWCGLKMPAY